MILPSEVVDEARAELRRRLALPATGIADETRAKLEQRLRKLAQLFQWDDITEAEYRAQVNETRMQLALIPEHDKVRSFDEVGAVVESLAAALDAATPDQVKQLIAMIVDEVTTKDRVVDEIRLRPEAMPFFTAAETLVLAPPDGLEPPTRTLGRCRSIH